MNGVSLKGQRMRRMVDAIEAASATASSLAEEISDGGEQAWVEFGFERAAFGTAARNSIQIFASFAMVTLWELSTRLPAIMQVLYDPAARNDDEMTVRQNCCRRSLSLLYESMLAPPWSAQLRTGPSGPNRRDARIEETPLFSAAKAGAYDAVKLLIAYGAKPDGAQGPFRIPEHYELGSEADASMHEALDKVRREVRDLADTPEAKGKIGPGLSPLVVSVLRTSTAAAEMEQMNGPGRWPRAFVRDSAAVLREVAQAAGQAAGLEVSKVSRGFLIDEVDPLAEWVAKQFNKTHGFGGVANPAIYLDEPRHGEAGVEQRRVTFTRAPGIARSDPTLGSIPPKPPPKPLPRVSPSPPPSRPSLVVSRSAPLVVGSASAPLVVGSALPPLEPLMPHCISSSWLWACAVCFLAGATLFGYCAIRVQRAAKLGSSTADSQAKRPPRAKQIRARRAAASAAAAAAGAPAALSEVATATAADEDAAAAADAAAATAADADATADATTLFSSVRRVGARIRSRARRLATLAWARARKWAASLLAAAVAAGAVARRWLPRAHGQQASTAVAHTLFGVAAVLCIAMVTVTFVVSPPPPSSQPPLSSPVLGTGLEAAEAAAAASFPPGGVERPPNYNRNTFLLIGGASATILFGTHVLGPVWMPRLWAAAFLLIPVSLGVRDALIDAHTLAIGREAAHNDPTGKEAGMWISILLGGAHALMPRPMAWKLAVGLAFSVLAACVNLIAYVRCEGVTLASVVEHTCESSRVPYFWASLLMTLCLVSLTAVPAEPPPAESSRTVEIRKQLADLQISLECSITCERFVDPVIAPDGHTYERAAIETWLAENGTSPLTGGPMPPGDLRPNYIVKGLLQRNMVA